MLLLLIYLAFIGLGLPDSLLGAAWPSMYPVLGVPVSYAGGLSIIIAGGTILSSLLTDRVSARFGTGCVTAFSVGLTAIALFGFSIGRSFWFLCLCAIPYGLGAGCVDAAINNYVALHYASRHMNWLHCMWGLGAMVGPHAMGIALRIGTWQDGYRIVALLLTVLTALLACGIPLWKRQAAQKNPQRSGTPFGTVFRQPGATPIFVVFFCYCALEQTAGLWASSYLVLARGMDSTTAARLAALFFLGITAGRAVCGFLAAKCGDRCMVRLGQGVALVGILLLLLPLPVLLAEIGLVVIGIGCAPIYPALLHATPVHFGSERSQAVMGMQMATAYLGTLSMPPLFGLLAQHVSIALYPWFLLGVLSVMVFAHESAEIRFRRRTA